MDSFALRRPDFAKGVQVIEVDHPATQSFKRERLRVAEVQVPPTLDFVAVDLSTSDLGTALKRSTYRKDRPAFFSWLGVTMYLTRNENLATFKAIAGCSAPGSELAFGYIDQREFDSALQSKESKSVQSRAGALGEFGNRGSTPRYSAQTCTTSVLPSKRTLTANRFRNATMAIGRTRCGHWSRTTMHAPGLLRDHMCAPPNPSMQRTRERPRIVNSVRRPAAD